MMLGDFHIHSTFSDGKLTIPEIVDFFGQRGFGAIAITDHLCEEKSFIGKTTRLLNLTLTRATFPIYIEILKSEARRAWKQYRMTVIPGIEITKNSLYNHRSAHILALGVDTYISADLSIQDICRTIQFHGGLAVAAHPVSTRKLEKQTFHLWDNRDELSCYFDAWEVASGPHFFDEVAESQLPMLANSDMHHPKQMTSWKTVLNRTSDQESILLAIKNQNLDFEFYNEGNQHEFYPASFSYRVGYRAPAGSSGKLSHV